MRHTKRTAARAVAAAAALAGAACGASTGASDDIIVTDPLTIASSGATHPTVALDPTRGTAYVAWVGQAAGGAGADHGLVGQGTEAGHSPAGHGMETGGDPARRGAEPGDGSGGQAGDDGETDGGIAAVGVEDGPRIVADQASGSGPGTAGHGTEPGRGAAGHGAVPAEGATAWNVYLARRSPGAGQFGDPVRVNDQPGDAAPHAQAPAQVAVGPDGTVYVVWQTTTQIPGRAFPASDLRLARSTDGGRTFSPAIYVNDDAGGTPTSHTFHDIAVAGDGAVYVSWIDGRNDASAGPQIRVSRSTDQGRTFSPGAIVDGEACPCCRTSLAAGPNGAVYVAWRKVFAGHVRDIVVARSVDGAVTFSPPRRVHRDGWVIEGCPHAGPSIAVDADGRVHVAWYTGTDGGAGLFYAIADDRGLDFGPARALLDGDFAPPSQARLTAAAGGRVWVAWEERSTEGSGVRLGVIERGGARVAPVARLGSGQVPALAAADGRAVITWAAGPAAHAAVARIAVRDLAFGRDARVQAGRD